MQPQQVYEPWSPRLGDRVTIRLSGECRALEDHKGEILPCSGGAPIIGHPPQQHGRSGTIRLRCDDFPCPHGYALGGHGYVVVYDVPYATSRIWLGGHFAAIELDPLDPPTFNVESFRTPGDVDDTAESSEYP